MTDINEFNLELIYVVVNFGMGSKVLHRAKEYGISGGTVFIGRGTVNNSFLNFFSLYDERKEILLMAADGINSEYAIKSLNNDFHFKKSNHGILFTTNVVQIIGSRVDEKNGDNENNIDGGINNNMYQVIFTIVNKGRAEDVIDAAKLAGSKGGTIINGRGSGTSETSKLFNMEIEPQKEMVMILSKNEIVDDIVIAIRKKLEIDIPGNGIIFVQNVNKTYGIYE